MISRANQQAVVWLVTLVFIAGAWVSLGKGNIPVFFGVIGFYLLLLIAGNITFLKALSEKQRSRPSVPTDIKMIRLGKLTARQKSVIQAGALKDEVLHKGLVHELIYIERELSDGVWSSYIEVCDDEIVAYSKGFRSALSPVLDCSKRRGMGLFFPE